MEDPVLAKDGFNYERAAIETWLKNHSKSPQTQKEMDNTLEPNKVLQETIQQFTDFVTKQKDSKCSQVCLTWEVHGMMCGAECKERKITLSGNDILTLAKPLQMCQALSNFFKEVDPVEDLLREMLGGLKVPKVVVVGDDALLNPIFFFFTLVVVCSCPEIGHSFLPENDGELVLLGAACFSWHCAC